MHIKTNIELSSVQIAVLAICPLIGVVGGAVDILYFLAGTFVCVFLSQLFCWIFNKYMTNSVKIFTCALISSFVVVMGLYVTKEIFNIVLDDNMYFIIFSSVVLCSDFIYYRHKAAVNHPFVNLIKILLIFSLIGFVFAFIREFLAFGTIFGKSVTRYLGFAFFETVASDFFILGILCFAFDILFRWIDKKIENKNIKYQKYIKTIRDEKSFQYDSLRRQKLLANNIEINNMNAKEAEKIIQKNSENEAITSVEEVLQEESEETVSEIEDEGADDSDKKGGKK